MPLIVENGSNIPNANSYETLIYFDNYHENAGTLSWTSNSDDTAKENAVIRATSRLETAYNWTGMRTNGRSQSLTWPRTNVADCEGIQIGTTEIPIEVKKAVAELAVLELLSPSYQTAATAAAATAAGEVKRQRDKLGELESEVEYFQSSTGESTSTVVDATQSLSVVSSLLKCFATPIDGGSNGSQVVFATADRI